MATGSPSTPYAVELSTTADGNVFAPQSSCLPDQADVCAQAGGSVASIKGLNFQQAAWPDVESHTNDLYNCLMNADCVTRLMRAAGASGTSVSFYRQQHTFLEEAGNIGPVTAGITFDPYLAGDPYSYIVETQNGRVVLPDQDVSGIALRGAQIRALRRVYSHLAINPGNAYLEKPMRTTDPGTTLVFTYPLTDGCAACQTGYDARISFPIRIDGTMGAPEMIDLCKDPLNQVGNYPVQAPTCAQPSFQDVTDQGAGSLPDTPKAVAVAFVHAWNEGDQTTGVGLSTSGTPWSDMGVGSSTTLPAAPAKCVENWNKGLLEPAGWPGSSLTCFFGDSQNNPYPPQVTVGQVSPGVFRVISAAVSWGD